MDKAINAISPIDVYADIKTLVSPDVPPTPVGRVNFSCLFSEIPLIRT